MTSRDHSGVRGDLGGYLVGEGGHGFCKCGLYRINESKECKKSIAETNCAGYVSKSRWAWLSSH